MNVMGKYALVNGIILDGTEDMAPVSGKIILINGDRIEAIRPQQTDISGYRRIDLNGQYVMPGLINMHVHLAGNGKPQKNAKLIK